MRDFFLTLINFLSILGPRRESKSHFRTRQIFERFHGRWWGLDGALWPLYLGTRLCQGRILLWRTYFATSTQSFVLSEVRSKFSSVKVVHPKQSQFREVPRWEIFMEQKLRFGPNGQFACLHSFKIFWPMKPSCTSNEMIQFVAHFDVSKIYEIKKEIIFF